MLVALATLLAVCAAVLVVALQLAARLSHYLAAADPATVGYATGSCQGLAFSLWFPIKPRPALPYFSYLQGQAGHPVPPWILPGRAGRAIAALVLALAPHTFRSCAVGSTSVAHWRRRRRHCRHSAASSEVDRQANVGSGGLVIMVQGFGASTFIAAELCEALASRGFAVAAIDLSRNEGVEARLAAVTALLGHILTQHSEHLDPGSVVVMGHSRGGSQAAHLALSDPRVRGAVLLHSNSGDMRVLMRARPLPSAQPAASAHEAALLVVHATDDIAVRPEHHSAWVKLLHECTQGSDTWVRHALVDSPCGHNGCTSLLTMMSFAMPRWIVRALSHLSRRISALQVLYPLGVTEPRARQLVAITSEYVCDFVEAVLKPNEGDLRRCGEGDSSEAQACATIGTDGPHGMQLFDGTALWLHEAGYWRLRENSAPASGPSEEYVGTQGNNTEGEGAPLAAKRSDVLPRQQLAHASI